MDTASRPTTFWAVQLPMPGLSNDDATVGLTCPDCFRVVNLSVARARQIHTYRERYRCPKCKARHYIPSQKEPQ